MPFYKMLIMSWYATMLVITGFLVAEYRYFCYQNQCIEQKKDDYSAYILALQKVIAEQQEAAKKKNEDLTEDTESSFLIVNREPEYLKKNALDFAQKANLEVLLKDLYDADSYVLSECNKNKKYSQAFIKSSSNRALNKSNIVKNGLQDRWKKLRKNPIFAWPLERSKCWISSLFGRRKKVDGSWGFHYGLDMAAHKGTPVYAAGDGTVIEAQYVKGYGNTIVIAHSRTLKTRYAHLDKILIQVADKVKKGKMIGKVGDTGFVRKQGKDASHLHFEVDQNGKRENPLIFLD